MTATLCGGGYSLDVRDKGDRNLWQIKQGLGIRDTD